MKTERIHDVYTTYCTLYERVAHAQLRMHVHWASQRKNNIITKDNPGYIFAKHPDLLKPKHIHQRWLYNFANSETITFQ